VFARSIFLTQLTVTINYTPAQRSSKATLYQQTSLCWHPSQGTGQVTGHRICSWSHPPDCLYCRAARRDASMRHCQKEDNLCSQRSIISPQILRSPEIYQFHKLKFQNDHSVFSTLAIVPYPNDPRYALVLFRCDLTALAIDSWV
jgi:hypothetical protein